VWRSRRRLRIKRCLLIAPKHSYRIAAYLRAARELGVELVIASDGKDSLVQELASGIHIDFDQVEAALHHIADYAEHHPLSAVLPSDDRSVPLSAAVASALNLSHNSPQTAITSRRKDLSRAQLQGAGLNVPAHQVLDIEALNQQQVPDFAAPWVLKPLSLSASSGVIRVDQAQALPQAGAQIAPIVSALGDPDEASRVLVESYIEGDEVAVEALVGEHGLSILAVFDKPDPLCGPYFEETLYVSPSRHSARRQAALRQQLQLAIEAMGIRVGPVHAEFRLDRNDQAWILEIATRSIGGDCARTLEYLHGHSLESMIIANALGLPLASPKQTSPAAGVMMIPTPKPGVLRRVEGIMAAQQVPGIESVELAVREGHELQVLPQASSYLGFIFARGEDPAQVEAALREAHAKLTIVVAPLFRLVGV